MTEDIKDAEKDIARWTADNDRLITSLRRGLITEAEFSKHRKFCVEPLEAAQERLAGLRRQQTHDDAHSGVLERFLAHVSQFRDYLDTLDDDGKAKVLRDVIAHATLDGDNVPRYGLLGPDEPVIFASTAEERAYRSAKSTPSAWT